MNEENNSTFNLKTLQEEIDNGNRQVEREQNNKYRNNVSFGYDQLVREEYRKSYPDKVEEIRTELIERQPKLKFFPELLERKIDKEIFPEVLEKQDYYVFTEDTGKRDDEGNKIRKTGGGTHLSLYDNENHYPSKPIREKQTEGGKYNMLISDIIGDMLDDLELEENTIVKMLYGLEPYQEIHSYKEISEKTKIPYLIVIKKAKRSIEKLKNKLILAHQD